MYIFMLTIFPFSLKQTLTSKHQFIICKIGLLTLSLISRKDVHKSYTKSPYNENFNVSYLAEYFLLTPRNKLIGKKPNC